jgi:hypothetical protein
VRKMLESHKQTSDEQVKELRQTIEELEEELVATADERDAYQSRLSDTSEREAANCTIAQLKQQLLVSKAEVQQLRQASVDKDTKIAQLRTQANAHATVAVAVAAPSSGLSESASGTPCRAADQLQHSRTLANAAENETTITNGAPTPKGASRKPSGRMSESAHIQRLRRARRNTMDRDSFSKGAPIAFLNAKKRVEEQAAAEVTAGLTAEPAADTSAVHAAPDARVVQQATRSYTSTSRTTTTDHRQQPKSLVPAQQQEQEARDRGNNVVNERTSGAKRVSTASIRASSPAGSKRGRSTPRSGTPRAGSQRRQKKQAGGGGLYDRLSSPGRSSLSNRRRSEAKTVSYVV